jgi:hypothetical protein
MAVSYRFHAYSPQRKDLGRRLRVKERQTLAEPEPSGRAAELPLHYGRRFAETEQRGQERALELPLEAYRGQAFSAPIGALPATEEAMNPQDALSPEERSAERADERGETKEGMDRVVAEAMEQVGVMTSAIRDLGESSFRLARLPWNAARALRQRRRKGR